MVPFFLGFVYFIACLAVTIFMLIMMWRFVTAHESIAHSLQQIAEKNLQK